jgi:integrase
MTPAIWSWRGRYLPISARRQPDPNTANDPSFASLDATVAELLRAVIAPNTRRAYQGDLDHFRRWGGDIPASALCVARYLAAHAETHSPATLTRRVVAIGRAHASGGLPDPTASELVRLTLRGIRRTYGRPQRRATALRAEHLAAIVATLDTSIKDVRDRALLLVGFAGAFRRSELSAAVCSDIEWRSQGIVLSLPRSKTDQEGQGRTVAIPCRRDAVCPVNALREWLEAGRITDGPLFRPITKGGQVLGSSLSGNATAEIVKQHVMAIGLDPELYSGHSLRAGFATSAAAAGVPSWKIRAQTGHASDAMLNRYIRAGELLAEEVSHEF